MRTRAQNALAMSCGATQVAALVLMLVAPRVSPASERGASTSAEPSSIERSATRQGASRCPPGSREDSDRLAAISNDLSHDPTSRSFADVSSATVCFGVVAESGILPDGTIVIDDRLAPEDARPRVAHLLHHLRAGEWFRTPDARHCEGWVGAALDEEAEALEVELEVAGSHSMLPFAKAAAAPSRGARVAIIRRWIEEHPEGGSGIPGYATVYRHRCEERGVR